MSNYKVVGMLTDFSGIDRKEFVNLKHAMDSYREFVSNPKYIYVNLMDSVGSLTSVTKAK